MKNSVSSRLARIVFPLGLSLSIALPGLAQEAGKGDPAVSFSGNVGVVSDYRVRGISLSNRDPALQGGFDMETRSGFYAGTWASTLPDDSGADFELNLYGGYASEAAGFAYSVGVYSYIYPGGDDLNYLELTSNIEKPVGIVTLGSELSYVPEQDNTGTDNTYIAGSASVPIGKTGFSLMGRTGYEDGFYDGKVDWEAALAFEYSAWTASIGLAGSDHDGVSLAGDNGETGFVAALTLGF